MGEFSQNGAVLRVGDLCYRRPSTIYQSISGCPSQTSSICGPLHRLVTGMKFTCQLTSCSFKSESCVARLQRQRIVAQNAGNWRESGKRDRWNIAWHKPFGRQKASELRQRDRTISVRSCVYHVDVTMPPAALRGCHLSTGWRWESIPQNSPSFLSPFSHTIHR